jgi:phosphoenolpyruvate carboxykinase (ATP)
MQPRTAWADPAHYDARARHLAGLFVENFRRFEPQVTEDVRLAGPSITS